MDKVIFLDALSSTKNSMMQIDIFLVSLHSTKSVEVGHSSTSPLDKLYLVLQYIRINRTVSNIKNFVELCDTSKMSVELCETYLSPLQRYVELCSINR